MHSKPDAMQYSPNFEQQFRHCELRDERVARRRTQLAPGPTAAARRTLMCARRCLWVVVSLG